MGNFKKFAKEFYEKNKNLCDNLEFRDTDKIAKDIEIIQKHSIQRKEYDRLFPIEIKSKEWGECYKKLMEFIVKPQIITPTYAQEARIEIEKTQNYTK